MFGSPIIDSHRLRNRDLRGSPLATHYYRSTQEQTIITIHVSSAHARKDASLFPYFAFLEKSGNMLLVSGKNKIRN